MLKVYLDANVWAFLDGQENQQCEPLRPSWDVLADLARAKRMRFASSVDLIQEVLDAGFRNPRRAHRLYSRVLEIVGRWFFREFEDFSVSEICAALDGKSFDPWAPRSLIERFRSARPEDKDLRTISDDSYAQKVSQESVYSGLENDFKARIEAAAMPIAGARCLDVRGQAWSIMRDTIPRLLSRHGRPIRSRQLDRIMPLLPATYAYHAFLFPAATAQRVPAQRNYKMSDPADARHFAYAVCADWLVTAEATLPKIAGLVPNSNVHVVSLKLFCEHVRNM